MLEAISLGPLNPSSIHQFGAKAKNLLESARADVLKACAAAKNYNLLFTCSGTEANGLLLHNFYDQQLIISSIEHASIYQHSWHNNAIQLLHVDSQGLVCLEHLRQLLQGAKGGSRILVSVIGANNETGVLQDLEQIVLLAKEYGALVHSDLSQMVGKVALNLDQMPLDFATISAHKFGGGVGAGGLFWRKNLNLQAQVIGGGQEKGLRAGTQNVPSIVAMAAALQNIEESIAAGPKIAAMRDQLEWQIAKYCQEVQIASVKAARLPNTSMIIMPGVEGQLQLMYFDLKGFAVSNGAACSSGKVEPSHVLKAMGFNEQDAQSAVRVSLASSNTAAEVAQFCQVWQEIYNHKTVK
jgi:cysteine desulfurase